MAAPIDFDFSTDKSRIDKNLVYDYLHHHSYWSAGIPRETVEKSIENSLCFGIYKEDKQVGFARVISDFATYAYLADVFIIPAFRGLGLSKKLMEFILAHPDLQGLRRFVLATKDAHSLYIRYGFSPYQQPDRLLCLHQPDIYKSAKK